MNKYLKRGISSFYSKNFKDSLLHFSLALRETPSCKEARIGAILAQLAMEKEDEVVALFEYYFVIKDSGVKNSEDLIEEIADSFELTMQNLEEFFIQGEIESIIQEEKGIAYEDFRTFIRTKGSFKEAFEDIMFSTKVIIHKKDDFLDFIGQLLDNGFEEVSMTYVETAVQLFPYDKQLLRMIDDNKTKK